jgi:hypothetical protein
VKRAGGPDLYADPGCSCGMISMRLQCNYVARGTALEKSA